MTGRLAPSVPATSLPGWVLVSTTIATCAQLVWQVGRQRIQHQFAWMSHEAAWMTPVAFITLFTLAALFLAVARLVPAARGTPATRWFSRERGPGLVLLVMGFFSAFLNVRAIHPVASFTLAIGAALFLERWLRAGPSRFRRAWRVAGMGLVVLGGFVAVRSITARERADRPPALPGAPNVLLLILDTVRASSLSLYGGLAPVPNLAALARSGTTFDMAFAPSSWTLPSHASVFSGIRPGALDVDMRTPLLKGERLLAESLRARGYVTGAFVGNLLYTSREAGFARGFDRYSDYPRGWKEVLLHANLLQTTPAVMAMTQGWRAALRAAGAGNWSLVSEPHHRLRRADVVLDDFLAWREESGGRPWFAFINLFDAHGEFPPAPGMPDSLGATPREREYNANIAFMDGQIGRVLARLKADGTWSRTLVIVTSDHGEQFGEHGLQGHGNSLYTQLLHVPLIISSPSPAEDGVHVSHPVGLLGLGREVLALTEAGAADHLTASRLTRDTLPVLSETNRTDGTWAGPTDQGALSSLVVGSLHYIRREDGREELFDLASDPGEANDLAEERPADVALLRARLAREQAEHRHAISAQDR